MLASPMTPDQQQTALEYKLAANQYFKTGEYQNAIEQYSLAITQDSTDPSFFGNRAAAHFQTANFGVALQDCVRALAISVNLPKIRIRAAKCNVHLGNLDEAEAQLSLALTVSVNESKLIDEINREIASVEKLKNLLNVTKNLVDQNSHAAALANIESIMIIVDPKLLGSGLPNSISRIATSLVLQKIPIAWRILRGKCLAKLFDVDEASQVAVGILRQDSRNPDALCLRAETMHILDSHPHSTILQFLTQCLTFDPDHNYARLMLKRIKVLEAVKKEGNEAFKEQNYDLAIEKYDLLIASGCEGVIKAKILSNRATCYNKNSRIKETVDDCCAALSILDEISFPKAWRTDKDSITSSDRGVCLSSPLYFKLYLRRADAHAKLEDFKESLKDYENAQAIKPQDPGTFKTNQKWRKVLEMLRKHWKDHSEKITTKFFKFHVAPATVR